MGYETRFEGTLAFDPFPDAAGVEALREGLSRFDREDSGRLVLTPMGRGVTVECGPDWSETVDVLERAITHVFGPKGVAVSGTLQVIGEDDRPVATVTVGEGGVEIAIAQNEEEEEEDAESLVEALGSEDPDLRVYAASQLAGYPEDGVAEALAGAARDDADEKVRRTALEALGELGEGAGAVVGEVIACLSDASPFIRYWATYALGRMGRAAEEALPQLEALTKDEAEGPRYGAVDAIRRIQAAKGG